VTDFIPYLLSEMKAGRLPKPDVARWLTQYRGDQLTDAGVLHPLLGRNTSSLVEQRFSTRFTGEEFYLRDHVVCGQKVLPAVCCLEMAHAAVLRSTEFGEDGGVELRDVVWLRPIVVTSPLEVHIALSAAENGVIEFEIYSDDKNDEIVHAQGRALPVTGNDRLRSVDLEQLRGGCGKNIEVDKCYQAFGSLGIEYGPSQRGLTAVNLGQDNAGRPYVLAKLEQPETAVMRGDSLFLHPSVADSALQSSIGLRLGIEQNGENKAAVPFALDSLCILHKLPAQCWAYVRESAQKRQDGMQRLDIDLCEDTGRVCVSLRGLALRLLGDGAGWKAASTAKEITKLQSPRHEAEQRRTVLAPESTSSEMVLLAPQWEAMNPSLVTTWPAGDESVLIVGGTPVQRQRWKHFFPQAHELEVVPPPTIEALRNSISSLGNISHVVWLAPSVEFDDTDWDGLLRAQETGVMALFRLIKAMLILGYGDRRLGWTMVSRQTQMVGTGEQIAPAHASIHGLIGSLAKEYEQWKIRLVDFSEEVEVGLELLGAVLRLPPDPRGDAWVYRGNEWYRRQLMVCQPHARETTSYRQGGVYVIIGGAGGLGEVFSEYLIKQYRAQIIWIGRREQNAEIEDKIRRFETFGPPPVYIQADASDGEALEHARRTIREQFGEIRGVVHAAITLMDKSLAEMTEDRFRACLSSKVDVSVQLARVFSAESLDWVLFFSSLQSFVKAGGQSNYAAGCTFKDAFAQYLAQKLPCAVKVVNWGYWGGAGIVAAAEYRERMAQLGIGSLEAPEGMEALAQLLNGAVDQLAAVKFTRPEMLAYLGEMREWVASADERAPRGELELTRRTQKSPDEKYVADSVDEAARDLDGLLARLLAAQLREVGLLGEGEQALQLSPVLERWLQHSQSLLSGVGLVELAGGRWRIVNGESIQREELWREWDERKDSWLTLPSLAAQVRILDVTVRALPDILRGTRPATSVMFPNASLELVEKIYKDNPIGNYFNAVLGDAVAEFVAARLAADPEARLRLLEIGAGTGGTTEAVLPRLADYPGKIAEYCYTDMSKVFLMHAEQAYRPSAPYLTSRIFDVEQGLERRGVPAGKFDIVIAANVLHATRHIRRTLRNAKAALKQGGLLVLNEITGSSLFTHLSFGLLEGWWLYEDAPLRIPGTPALATESWQRVLESEGFVSVGFPAQAWHRLGQQIIVAESDGIFRQESSSPVKVTSLAAANINPANAVLARCPSPVSTVNDLRKVSPQPLSAADSAGLLRDRTIAMVKRVVGQTLKMSPQQLDENESLEMYGIDSILVGKLRNQLAVVFPEISTTLFFEYRTVASLADYFMEHEPAAVRRWVGFEESGPGQTESTPAEVSATKTPSLHRRQKRRRRTAGILAGRASDPRSGPAEIAIIGLSGRYPGARNVAEFWENLKNGRNCIREIPPERWDWRKHYSAGKGTDGKNYARWGGFLDDIDMFDPLFFPLSPAEAERMDPQERLFLQEAYASIEDAGYTPPTLCSSRKVGVYVGVIYSNYAKIPSQWSVPNRVSFLLNFQGPSIAIDTACSSSLTALHLAIEGLRCGDCRVAIAGGVNLIVDPAQHLNLSSINMLSSGNCCKAFGAGADGFVDGEGVGAVVLKPLDRAIADGDHIYGVIKAGVVNAGGRTNGYTVPNPAAQSDVISEAISRAGVDARAISYIEAHGTGTELGDPIEIEGLRQAFAKSMNGKSSGDGNLEPFCAIGSVKTNVGHLESAAGIAGLTKVLLQMKYRTLVPSLHAEVLNPHIDFSRTPFRVQRQLSEWKRLVLEIDGQPRELPRLAGLSSFGAGGANAHLLIEEYCSETSADTAGLLTIEYPALIVLSAKNEERLTERVEQLAACLAEESRVDAGLGDLAYTLQVGREAMECRLALTATSISELRQKLDDYLNGKYESGEIDECYRGDARRSREAVTLFAADEDLQAAIESWIAKRKYGKLLDAWVKGLSVDWTKLYQDGRGKPRRISLPSYPFARERYWKEPIHSGAASESWLHPLLERNTSTLAEHRFSTRLTGDEPFLQDHVVLGRRVLPGVCYLEMARAAVLKSLEAQDGEFELKNIEWLQPIVAGAVKQVHIALNAQVEGNIGFEIYSDDQGDEVVHAQGRAVLTNAATELVGNIDLAQLKRECVESISPERCYAAFASLGIEYGPSQRGLKSVGVGKSGTGRPYVLAQLELPETVVASGDDLILHPSVMDSALQAAIGLRLAGEQGGGSGAVVPFALGSVRILRRVPAQSWAYVYACEESHDGVRRLDIDVCAESGQVCVMLRGLALHPLADASEWKLAIVPDQAISWEPLGAVKSVLPDNRLLRERAIAAMKRIVGQTLMMSPQQLDENESLESYGIDSILVGKLRNQLAEVFPDVKATIFFERRTVAALADYFLEHEAAIVRNWVGLEETTPVPAEPEHTAEHAAPLAISARPQRRRRLRTGTGGWNVRAADGPPQRTPVAIIGLSGRYPQASNVWEFWENLKSGRNCISEIPPERWDWREYYAAEKGTVGKIYSKWGGFLDNIDKFDPLFFRLSPAEAERMDPQERLFLQEAYRSIEDSGYTAATLCASDNVGVYVGVMNSNYALHSSQWSIANRVSFLFNFQGPSMAVDTACSSSLTAIHLAVEGLLRGECDVAIVGGVNLIVDPIQYANLSAMTMLSADDRCKAFGAGADGFVDGEGVGAVVLKPLDRAIADQDHIYGVVQASVLNAGGRTNGYTVPNPTAQSDLVYRAIRSAGVDSRSISYIEAHGTGTELGDPIEIEGLRQAFERSLPAAQPGDERPSAQCAIGSVKTNIGHLESAAGIAALTKVLLQMQHRTLVPSLHSEVLNPHIDFSRTPFHVQRELSEWKRPVLEVEGQTKELPRLAGISSFGAGGANAHILISEYCPELVTDDTVSSVVSRPSEFILLSAKNPERLSAQVEQLLHHIAAVSYTDSDLQDLAYTLQVGREAMEWRLAFTANSIDQLRQKLDDYRQGKFEAGDIDECYRGETRAHRDAISALNVDEDVESLIDAWLAKGKYVKLLDLWVKGLSFDWNRLHSATPSSRQRRPRRISLPGYSFAQERYWRPGHNRRGSVSDLESRADRTLSQPAPKAAPQDLFPQTIEEEIERFLMDALGLEQSQIERNRHLSDYGIDSVVSARLLKHLENAFGVELKMRELFEHATIGSLARHAAAQKKNGTHSVSSEALQESPAQTSIPLRNAKARIPLTPPQRSIYLHEQTTKEPVYHVPVTLLVRGDLRADALQRSLEAMVARHESLRTTFFLENGELWQRVHDTLPPAWTYLDHCGASREESAEAWRRIASVPFDLGAGPLLRAALIRRDDEWLLGICAHHLIVDGWSFGILLDELRAAYAANCSDRVFEAPALICQYGDYAIWRRQLASLSEKSAAARLADRIKDLPNLDLAIWRSRRPATPSFRGGTRRARISPELSARIRNAAEPGGFSVFGFMTACLELVLARHTGQPRFAVGVPFACRQTPEIACLIGHFANTVPIVAAPALHDTFSALLSQVRAELALGQQDEVASMEDTLSVTGARRDPRFSPLFQVMCVMQPARIMDHPEVGLSMEFFSVDFRTTLFDLVMQIVEMENQFDFVVNFNKDVVGDERADLILSDLLVVIESAGVNPEQRIEKLLQALPLRIVPVVVWDNGAGEIANGLRTLSDRANVPLRISVVPLFNPADHHAPRLNAIAPDGEFVHVVIREDAATEPCADERWLSDKIDGEPGSVPAGSMVVDIRSAAGVSGTEENVLTVDRRATPEETAEAVFSTIMQALDRRGLRIQTTSAAFPQPGAENGQSVVCVQSDCTPTGTTVSDEEIVPALDYSENVVGWLRSLWAECLGRPNVELDDDFVLLGGTSLSALRVLAQVRERFGMNLPLRAIFEYPTVAEFAERHFPAATFSLSPDKAEHNSTISGPAPVCTGSSAEASAGQIRIALLDRLDPGSGAFNVPLSLRIRGNLDTAALEAALNAIDARHEPLRSAIALADGNDYMQNVQEHRSEALSMIDLSGLPTEDLDARLERVRQAEAAYPFDLASGVLWKRLLVRCSREDHCLLITLHHAACDAWSIKVLAGEIAEGYGAAVSGRAPRLSDLPLRYLDYAIWQRSAHDLFASQQDYWKAQLIGVARLDLPTDHTRTTMKRGQGGLVFGRIPRDVTSQIRELAAAQGSTPFMVLLAAFSVVLHNHTSQTDILIGSTVAGRIYRNLEAMIGCFINTISLRVQCMPDDLFLTVLERARESVTEGILNQNCPVEQVLDSVKRSEDAGQSPLIQVLFNFLDVPATQLQMEGLEVEATSSARLVSKVDLDLFGREDAGEIVLELEYDKNLFEAASAAWILDHLIACAKEIVNRPSASVRELSIAAFTPPNAEAEWPLPVPASFIPIPEEEISLAGRISEVCREHAELLAIVDGSTQLTYSEFDRVSGHLAGCIADRWNDHERIALLCSHDWRMPAAVAAVLRTGKTYVPLDPRAPDERLTAMLADCEVTTLVCCAEFLERAQGLSHVLTRDGNSNLEIMEIPSTPDANATHSDLVVEENPDAPAYVLYTSGSTGRPKGVVQTRKNVVAHIRNYAQRIGISPGDRLAMLASYVFDAGVMDLFGAILTGATLLLVDPRSEDPSGLRSTLANASILHSTPTMFRYLLQDTEEPWLPSGARVFVLGGEEVRASELRLFEHHFDPRCSLVNGYGPTECTLAFQYCIARGDDQFAAVPVGRPVPGVSAELVDEAGNTAPVCGEIVLQSRSLAAGYWRQPEATALAFSTNAAGVPTYRTGDLGRWRRDGRLVFVGRKDQQVKIRGHRVETGEIESLLRMHPAVRNAAVVAIETPQGSTQLVAYVCGVPEFVPDPADLQLYMRRKLPEYAVPASIVLLENLPLTLTGKVDRQRLPSAPPVVAVGVGAPPRTAMEKTVAAIWQEVLGVSGIGCDQNFFDAGGDSLLIARVQSKLVSELGRPVAMTDLFIHSTVSALAAALDQPEPEDKQPDEARWRAEKRRAARPRHVAVEVDKPMEEITL